MKYQKLTFALAILVSTQGFSLTVDEYLKKVKTQNQMYKSYETLEESAKLKEDVTDIDLSPVLTAGYVKNSDKSLPSQLGGERKLEQYTLGLQKKFFTGTALSVQGKTTSFLNPGTMLPGYDQYTTGEVEWKVQQSLWKDFFGSATRTKLERLTKTAKYEQAAMSLQKRVFLIEAEAAYWDYVVALEDLKIKIENKKKSDALDKWMERRVSNGISDQADLMNIKSLSERRSLELLTAQDNLKTAEVKFREKLGLKDSESTPTVNSKLTTEQARERSYIQKLAHKKNILKIETYMSSLEAQMKQAGADETKDALRPDLSVFGAYATTSYDREKKQALKEITKNEEPRTTVGVNFTWVIENGAVSGQRAIAAKEALAAQYKAENKIQEGKDQWLDLVRQQQTTIKTIESLEKLAQYQKTRAQAEQKKLSQGRTVTSNVVNAETDSADAEISLLKAKAGLQKLETSSLQYMSSEDLENNYSSGLE